MNKNNPYGYKIGYQDTRLFIRKFITRTHKQAYHMLMYYRKFEHQQTVQKFNYEIQPITKKEVLAGIWDELPFSTVITTTPYKFPFRHGDRSIGQTQKSKTAEKLFRFSQLFSFIKTFSLFNFDFREDYSSHTCPHLKRKFFHFTYSFDLCNDIPAEGKFKFIRSKKYVLRKYLQNI